MSTTYANTLRMIIRNSRQRTIEVIAKEENLPITTADIDHYYGDSGYAEL
jgi:hypothetical protein